MPFTQEDAFNGVMVERKPLQEFAVLGPKVSCGFAFKGLAADQAFVAWLTDDAGNRWQLDENLHLVQVIDGDEQVCAVGIALPATSGDDTRVRPAERAAVAIAAAGIASAVYQRAADAADRRRFPPPGRLVDIGGRRMHLLATGEGTPAVIIIPALGSNVLEWERVLRAASAETTVCAYDRAGLGWSDPRHGPRRSMPWRTTCTRCSMPRLSCRRTSLQGIRWRHLAGRFRSRYPADVPGCCYRLQPRGPAAAAGGYRAGLG